MKFTFKNNADEAQKEKSALAVKQEVSNIANFEGDTTFDLTDQGDTVDFSVDAKRSHVRLFANKEEDVTKRLQTALNDGYKINKITPVIQAIINTFLSVLTSLRAITSGQTAEYNVLIKNTVVKVIFPVVAGQPINAKEATVLVKTGVTDEEFLAIKNEGKESTDATPVDNDAPITEEKKKATNNKKS